MIPSVPQPDALPENATSASEPRGTAPSPLTASQPMVLPRQPEEEATLQNPSFYIEDEQFDLGTPFVTPFQLSNAMPTVVAPPVQAQPSNQAFAVPTAAAASLPQPGRHKRTGRFSLPMIAILVCVIVIGGLLVLSVLAQTTPPLQTRGGEAPVTIRSGKQQQPTARVLLPTPTIGTHGQGQGQAQGQPASEWVPQQLPAG